MKAEGWYRDPFERHEERWISDGRPTALVRDGQLEAQDPPPEDNFDAPLVEVSRRVTRAGGDLRRADDPTNDDTVFDRVFEVNLESQAPLALPILSELEEKASRKKKHR